MSMIKVLTVLSLIGSVLACGNPGDDAELPAAEPAGGTMKNIGDHVVHFSAMTTDQLPPEIAREYNIVRSGEVAMLTVSVIAVENNSSVPATVGVKAINMTGQLKNILMRRVDEQEAIYYIGDTPIVNREMLIFDITVQPDGVDTPSKIRFRREFFTDWDD